MYVCACVHVYILSFYPLLKYNIKSTNLQSLIGIVELISIESLFLFPLFFLQIITTHTLLYFAITTARQTKTT